MKTKGMDHQIIGLEQSDRRSYYGYLMEQGTGKTWLTMADVESKYERGLIDGLMVVAPKGVHTNWTRIEIPTHMEAPHISGAWRSGMGVAEEKALNKLLEPTKKLRIFAMNYDAANTAKGFVFAQRFLESCNVGAYLAADESQRIKGHDTARTKKVLKLSQYALVRRILSGTPITKNPGDVFSQFEFLKSGLLGTDSYRAFFAQYAQLMDAANPTTDSDWQHRKMIEKNPRMAFAMIVARDDITGRPIYRNLDKLARLVEKHSYRVLKKDCLDLPEKIYQIRQFELTGKQKAAYNLMEQECRILLEDNKLQPVVKLAALMKLQQITSGYVIVPGRDEPMFVAEDNPRLSLLLEILEDIEGKVIIWARFKPELHLIAETLRKMGKKVAEYHGGIKEREREEAVDWFQRGDADVFLGNAQSGGLGLTLTAAETMVYYSNSFNNGDRMQSEDRNHRKGTKNACLYIDMSCVDTIDETIAKSLQTKSDLAHAVLDERGLDTRSVDLDDN